MPDQRELARLEKTRFLPWVGKEYWSGSARKQRLLLLGESHYSGDQDEPRTLTQDLTADYIRANGHSFGE